MSEDGTEYTFKLRQGVKWHSSDTFTPTRDFNADDVIFLRPAGQCGQPLAPVHTRHHLRILHLDGHAEPDQVGREIDNYTVKFTLSQPEAPFLANIAMPFASIVSKEYADTLEAAGTREDLNNLPIGTGPFSSWPIRKTP